MRYALMISIAANLFCIAASAMTIMNNWAIVDMMTQRALEPAQLQEFKEFNTRLEISTKEASAW
jgi:hypothetical protein